MKEVKWVKSGHRGSNRPQNGPTCPFQGQNCLNRQPGGSPSTLEWVHWHPIHACVPSRTPCLRCPIVQVPKGPPHRANKFKVTPQCVKTSQDLPEGRRMGAQSAVSRPIWPEKGPKGPFWGQICPLFSSHGHRGINMGQHGST